MGLRFSCRHTRALQNQVVCWTAPDGHNHQCETERRATYGQAGLGRGRGAPGCRGQRRSAGEACPEGEAQDGALGINDININSLTDPDKERIRSSVGDISKLVETQEAKALGRPKLNLSRRNPMLNWIIKGYNS